MKKYTEFRMFIEYVLVAFASYLVISLAIAIIGGHQYVVVLRSQYQIAGTIFIYWWIPIIRLIDIQRHNDSIK